MLYCVEPIEREQVTPNALNEQISQSVDEAVGATANTKH